MATRNKYDETIDMGQRLEEDGNEDESAGKIAALFGE